MTDITIHASVRYNVRIGAGLLCALGDEAAALGKAERVCLVSDSTVFPLYGEAARQSLLHAGFTVAPFIVPAGEQSKSAESYIALLRFLARSRLTRSDLIVALGGGVVGDLAGFAAATYLRGLRFIQVPTTLLAAVDSSVGGKTAIDLPEGKNLCGAFYQPSAVLCDTQTLATLPAPIFRDGCAEVIKYAVLYDEALFDTLAAQGTAFDREGVIARCVEHKRRAVERDEFDRGARKMLNLGHTVGHAVEACSGYTIAHGSAVAIGMAVVSRAAQCADAQRIVRCLEAFGLPTASPYGIEALYPHLCADKKCTGRTIELIVPRRIGACDIQTLAQEALPEFLAEGM